MNGRVIDRSYAIRDAKTWYKNKKLNVHEWKRNVKMAANQSRLTIAKRSQEGLEYSYALVDLNRTVVKKSMMTPVEAYKRNKVTKLVGLAWVLCG
jgi:hypothetical protein